MVIGKEVMYYYRDKHGMAYKVALFKNDTGGEHE